MRAASAYTRAASRRTKVCHNVLSGVDHRATPRARRELVRRPDAEHRPPSAAKLLHHFRRLRRAVGRSLASHPEAQSEWRFAPPRGIAQPDLFAGADQSGGSLELL